MVCGLLCGTAAGFAGPTGARAEGELGAFFGGAFYSTDGAVARNQAVGPGTPLADSGVFGLRAAYLPAARFALEAELGFSPTGARGPLRVFSDAPNEASQPKVAILPLRAHALVYLTRGRVRPLLLIGGGALIAAPLGGGLYTGDFKGELHAGAGLALDVGPGWGLRAEGRLELAQGLTRALTPQGQVLLAVFGRFGRPLPPPGPPTLAAIPPEALLPETPETPTAPPGLPPPAIVPPAPTPPPVEAPPPATPSAPATDSDGDGIPDPSDRCPTQPETRNGFDDEDGCPDELPVGLKQVSGVIQGLVFRPFSSEILPSSHQVLNEAAKVLLDYATLRLEIGGHTDPAGDPQANRLLSQQRADAVRQYLIGRGVQAWRLMAVGYGSERPRFPNTTPQGRAQNRRVEFTPLF